MRGDRMKGGVREYAVTATQEQAADLRMGTVYTDTKGRAALRLVAIEDRPDGRLELWWEQVPHCPRGRHLDRLALPA